VGLPVGTKVTGFPEGLEVKDFPIGPTEGLKVVTLNGPSVADSGRKEGVVAGPLKGGAYATPV
jgi:hypothetical protein